MFNPDTAVTRQRGPAQMDEHKQAGTSTNEQERAGAGTSTDKRG